MSNKRLLKKVAIVTGASSGVGRAIVLALANEGADLALLGRSMDLLQGLAHHCNERGSDSVLCVHVDLLSEESTQQAKKKVEAVFDGADILVHSAGMIMQGHVATAPLNDFNLQHRCNVMAPLLLTQLFLPSLIKTHGHIVFINSTAGLVSSAGLSQYSATKHTLKALAKPFDSIFIASPFHREYRFFHWEFKSDGL